MPTSDIVTAMIHERDRLDRAIAILRGSHRGGTATITKTVAAGGSRRRSPMSAAARKALSTKLRAAWAKRKKVAGAAKKS